MRETKSAEDIWKSVQEMGFLPLFQNDIKGFSIEEWTPRQLWFSDTEPGPWEWKGPIIRMGDCFYGKFFAGKAGFISKEWFPAFANYRRDGYDFDALYEDGKAARKDKYVYDMVAESGSLLTGELKKSAIMSKAGTRALRLSLPGCRCRPIWWWRTSSICGIRPDMHTGGAWRDIPRRSGWQEKISYTGNIRKNQISQGKPCMDISKSCFQK